ncbi:amino acid ABC transporter ATP-binding protein [Ancylobacter sp. sgz301288]|uniref:amino acid ABC transporter ATP-binding protein n=1 Tax=Ancylobacter sp. sgz301288 TaxID=3342077 RepID=UPI0038581967
MPVLRGVSLELSRGQVVGLIGPSGSGKSSVLRAIIGLLKPSAGRVALNGTVVDYSSAGSLRLLRDRVAIVFQQYNLFQHMTALENVSIAPVLAKGRPRGEVQAEAEALLEKVGLADRMHHYPRQLSGGQQQRVAMARALALKPELLLLDEVTSALDPELVNEVLDTIGLLAADGMTMLIVSHEMAFIREVADQVVFMDEGQVIEAGPPSQVLDDPHSERARRFAAKILRHHWKPKSA